MPNDLWLCYTDVSLHVWQMTFGCETYLYVLTRGVFEVRKQNKSQQQQQQKNVKETMAFFGWMKFAILFSNQE